MAHPVVPSAAIDPTVDLAEVAARLGRLLRAEGLPITPERSGRFAAALALVDVRDLDAVRRVARVTLVSDRTQTVIFERVFERVFRGAIDDSDARVPVPRDEVPDAHDADHVPADEGSEPTVRDGGATAGGQADTGAEQGTETSAVLAVASEDERLRAKDFAALTPEELTRSRSLMRGLRIVAPSRPARRRVRDPRGSRPDLRATLARAHRTGGDPIVTVRRRVRSRPRRVVLLCDVSGSMAPYARAYLQLLHSAVGGTRAEAFVFATRLTRLTRILRVRDPDVALARAGAAAPDWSGGTRIGAAIKGFMDEHGRRGMARGAVVVIVSDGWERGDPEVLGREMRRLRLVAHRVVWVNPRRAAPGFEPLVRGMVAALPWVDVFVSGHSLAAFDEVLAAIHGGEEGA